MTLTGVMQKIASVDLFAHDLKSGELATGLFIGRPYALDYDHAYLLLADAWKLKAKGIPQGSFLLTYYENEEMVSEALLLRVLADDVLVRLAQVHVAVLR